jgi:hypothetical protein
MNCSQKKIARSSKEIIMAKTLKDKVQKARFNASPGEVAIAAGQTVYRNARTAKVNLNMGEEEKAKKTLTPRMTQDRNKTLARGVAIEKREAKKAAAKRAAAAIGNSPTTKKAVKKIVKKAGNK